MRKDKSKSPMSEDAMRERAQVVKYLRDTQSIFLEQKERGERPLVAHYHAECCEYAALYIEMGEHTATHCNTRWENGRSGEA